MVIKRRFACYCQLLEDAPSKKAMIDAFKKYGVNEEEAIDHLSTIGGVIVHNTDEGSCIPYDIYNDFCTAFEELDKTAPFDNRLSYNDVSGIVHFASRKGNAMTQVMYCQYHDMPVRIVQVIAFEHDGESIRPIEPWDLPQIIF